MTRNESYKLGPEEFLMDVVMPSLPFAGLIVIPIAIIDLNTDIERIQTQGKVRLTAALSSQLTYILLIILAAWL